MQFANQSCLQRSTTIKKILCLVPAMSIASLIHAQDLTLEPKSSSIIQGAIKTLDQTVQVLKSSKQEMESLDDLVVHSINEIGNTVNKISNEIPKEQLKAAEVVCKAEIRHAEQTVKELFNYHKKNLNKNLDVVLGKDNKDKIVKEVESCSRSIQDKANQADVTTSLDLLGEKLNAVEQPLTCALENLAEEQAMIMAESQLD